MKNPPEPPIRRNPFKAIVVIFLGIIGVIYLLNPSAGVLELIPDNIPFLGNLDEALAVTLILNCARYFGFDLTRWFIRK